MSGASGAGKSTVIEGLRDRWPQVVVHEDDELPAPPDQAGRHRILDHFLDEAVAYRKAGKVMLYGTNSPLGEVLAAPLAVEVGPIAACVLDCSDRVRVQRVRSRDDGASWFGQDQLNWAAFHRMHAADPQWCQSVITACEPDTRHWSRWTGWQAGDPRWRVGIVSTTELTVQEMVARMASWVQWHLRDPDSMPLQGQWWA